MNRIITLLFSAILMLLATASVSLASDAISLPASEPYTMYYTTNGATPSASTGSTSAVTATSVNYYVAQGTTIIPPSVPLANEVISLVPNAGHKGKQYVKPHKQKIYESRYAFEKYLKEKHGIRYKVEDFDTKQTDNGNEGHLYIVESKNAEILQLSDICTEGERAHRIAIAKDFILNNPELVGITENEELHERGRDRQYCGSLYLDRFVNGYELLGSDFRFRFVPQWNFGFSVHLKPITPEMYAAAQADALSPEEIAKIVYQDLGIPVDGKNGKKPPKLEMYKYLQNEEPYVYWRIAYHNVYTIDAITGAIISKSRNVRR